VSTIRRQLVRCDVVIGEQQQMDHAVIINFSSAYWVIWSTVAIQSVVRFAVSTLISPSMSRAAGATYTYACMHFCKAVYTCMLGVLRTGSRDRARPSHRWTDPFDRPCTSLSYSSYSTNLNYCQNISTDDEAKRTYRATSRMCCEVAIGQ
jgi:hypothetical protein